MGGGRRERAAANALSGSYFQAESRRSKEFGCSACPAFQAYPSVNGTTIWLASHILMIAADFKS